MKAIGLEDVSQPNLLKPRHGEPKGQLYNLEDDPAETNNLWSQHPDIVNRLNALLEKYRTQGHSRKMVKKGKT